MNNLPLFDIKSFHSSFLLIQEPEDSTADMFESFVSSNRLASPGMEHLLEEQMRENKKMKSNVKFNKAFDVAKVCAEYLSKYNTEAFLINIEVFKAFTELMRTGLPDGVKDAILNTSSSSTESSSTESSSTESSSTESSSTETSSTESSPSESSFTGTESGSSSSDTCPLPSKEVNNKPVVRELPPEHQVSTSPSTFNYDGNIQFYKCSTWMENYTVYFQYLIMPFNFDKFQALMRDIMLIFPVSGDGACLYNAVAAFLYGDEGQSSHLRKMAHEFIVMHWWYWKYYITLPFTETVGVGNASYTVNKKTEKELFEFLQSEESLKMWSTQPDIAVLANMCNLTIHTFTYNVPNQPPS